MKSRKSNTLSEIMIKYDTLYLKKQSLGLSTTKIDRCGSSFGLNLTSQEHTFVSIISLLEKIGMIMLDF